MTAPVREGVLLPVSDERDILRRKGAELDQDPILAGGAMLPAKRRQADYSPISGAAVMPAGPAGLMPARTTPHPSAVDAFYDARRGVCYAKPVLRAGCTWSGSGRRR